MMPDINLTELARQLAELLEPPLIPDRTPQDDDAFPTTRFVRFDRDPDEVDRVLVLHADGFWRDLTGASRFPQADGGLPYDIDTDRPIEGRRIDLPAGAVVRHLLQALAFAGAFEIWGDYHERRAEWDAAPDPWQCALADGRYRFRALSDLYLQHILAHPPQFETEAEPAPPGVLRVYGGIALELARQSGFPLRMRDKTGAIVDCPLDEAGFLLRRISEAASIADVRHWLRNGERDIFLDLRPTANPDSSTRR